MLELFGIQSKGEHAKARARFDRGLFEVGHGWELFTVADTLYLSNHNVTNKHTFQRSSNNIGANLMFDTMVRRLRNYTEDHSCQDDIDAREAYEGARITAAQEEGEQ